MTTTTTSRHVVDAGTAEAFLGLSRLAVVGASTDPKKFGHTIYCALRDRPAGTVVPVHPTATTVAGDAAYPSVAAVPGTVDGVIVMVPGEAALAAVDEALDAGVRQVWLFKGVGGGHGALSDEAVARCEARGATVVAGACPLMFLPAASGGGVHRLHRRLRRWNGSVREAAA
jgi:predicted CoA-binding protein